LRALDPENNKNLFAENEDVEWSVRGLFHRTLLRPLKMLLVEPILLFITIYISIVYGIIYASEFVLLPEFLATHVML
jgi:MFS transporter, DHA1 family, multidrug resistance protein